jgi:predicted membrane protein
VSFDDLSSIIFSLGVMFIGISGLLEKKRFDFVLVMFVIFGGLYFLSNIGYFDKQTINIIMGPSVIITVGLALMLCVGKRRITDKPVVSYTALFSGVEDKNVSDEYESSEITAIFGGAEIDYRKIKIRDKVGYINITVAFGGVTIYLPEDVKVTVNGMPIFGGAENNAVSKDDSKKELIINYTVIFGGVEIKN